MEDGGRNWSDVSQAKKHLGLLATTSEAGSRQGTDSASEGTNPPTP